MPLIQVDAPHPHSYRPDLPLRSELHPGEPNYNDGYSDGHEEGVDDGEEEARRDYAEELRTLEVENRRLREKLGVSVRGSSEA